ncbi:spermidine synthase [Myroides injenensis]|uniref:spermidine synthase n=1 Tax=Myroides injenensis TaxID=1183151 RepID=UPI00028A0B64|nr:spermine synthase [Myroides injenensis]
MLKRALSYIYPITEKKIPSKVNTRLDVIWNKGKLELDTKHTNYSYGNLEKVLKNGLQFIGFEKIKSMDKVLVLGLGAGSIINILRTDIKFTGHITSVELDPTIIYIGEKYFKLNAFNEHHDIYQMDAFEYVLCCQDNFDLIIIDIFQDFKMPSFLFEDYFVNHLKKLLNVNGFILFNTIVLNTNEEDRNKNYAALFNEEAFSVRMNRRLQKYNEIITVKRIS